MPKYDYRCGQGHQYEKREGFDAPALQVCQLCGTEARRVFTPPAIVFKGSGWYINDSRKSSSSGGSDAPASTDGTPATPADSAESASTPTPSTAPAPVTPSASSAGATPSASPPAA